MNPKSDEIPATGIVLPETEDLTSTELIEFGAAAEQAGFESIWCAEGWGYSPFVLLGRLSEVTDCPLGTGIANAFARSPMATAMHALTLHEATNGQFMLGIGASTKSIVERFHGTEYERPIRRLRETIEILRAAFSGEQVEYDGELLTVDGYALQHTADPVSIPVVNAALGPTNVAMTVEYADGIMTYLHPFEAIPSTMERAERKTGQTADLLVTAQLPTCVSDDTEKAREVLSRHLAYYVGEIEAYNSVVARNGFAEIASRVEEMWQAGDHADARAAITDELMDAVGIVGTPTRARAQLDALLDGPVDTALLSFPSGVDEEMRRSTLDVMAE